MAAELGAEPVLCGFQGGESGAILEPLLDGLPGERHLVPTAGASGCYVTDRRDGGRDVLASALAPPPRATRSMTCSRSRWARHSLPTPWWWCNPFPPESLPARALRQPGGRRARGRHPGARRPLVPRLDSALEGRPDLVKLNDWELAEYVAARWTAPACAQLPSACATPEPVR